MLKYSWLALAVLLAFGAVVALLPEPSASTARSGVTLRNVSLRLYPAQDQNAEWRFYAPSISFDPLSGETQVRKPEQGERYLRENGEFKLDMTITTEQLVIDQGDNLRTSEARLYIPADCTTVDLKGDAESPVRIDQSAGYSAPFGRVSSHALLAEYENFASTFQLETLGEVNVKKLELYPDTGKICNDGRIIEKAVGGKS